MQMLCSCAGRGCSFCGSPSSHFLPRCSCSKVPSLPLLCPCSEHAGRLCAHGSPRARAACGRRSSGRQRRSCRRRRSGRVCVQWRPGVRALSACKLDAGSWKIGEAKEERRKSSGICEQPVNLQLLVTRPLCLPPAASCMQYTEPLEVDDLEAKKWSKFDGTRQYARDKRRQVGGCKWVEAHWYLGPTVQATAQPPGSAHAAPGLPCPAGHPADLPSEPCCHYTWYLHCCSLPTGRHRGAAESAVGGSRQAHAGLCHAPRLDRD